MPNVHTFGQKVSMKLLPPSLPIEQIETREVLKKLTETRAALAELKGVATTIPNEQILIDTLTLQEAKDSSAIENIVTTHDEIYQSNYEIQSFTGPAAKEVHTYAVALKEGFKGIQQTGTITINGIIRIQQIIERNQAGIRKLPGTVLRNELTGEVVYTPPQHPDEIQALLYNLEAFINDDSMCQVDPLVKMAIIHHQFESIHPFYDGNGRTGRILNILYLIKEKLLDLPILYISHYIIRHRQEYYRQLQSQRESDTWTPWILFMLEAVHQSAEETVHRIKSIKQLMLDYKRIIRKEEPRMYSQDLLNNLFRHPYTKVELVRNDLHVTRVTATRYLERLVELQLLKKVRRGRSNYYINIPLFTLLQN